MSTTPSGNHESLKSKIPKRKKASSNYQLSCKIEYYIKTSFACFLARSAFFTDDRLLLPQRSWPGGWRAMLRSKNCMDRRATLGREMRSTVP